MQKRFIKSTFASNRVRQKIQIAGIVLHQSPKPVFTVFSKRLPRQTNTPASAAWAIRGGTIFPSIFPSDLEISGIFLANILVNHPPQRIRKLRWIIPSLSLRIFNPFWELSIGS